MSKNDYVFPFDEHENLKNDIAICFSEPVGEEREECLKGKEIIQVDKVSGEKVIWRPNKIFEARVEYDSYENRRSSTLMFVHDVNTGIKYPMFMAEYDKMLKSARSMGVIYGMFTFVRKGKNYSLSFLKKA